MNTLILIVNIAGTICFLALVLTLVVFIIAWAISTIRDMF